MDYMKSASHVTKRFVIGARDLVVLKMMHGECARWWGKEEETNIADKEEISDKLSHVWTASEW